MAKKKRFEFLEHTADEIVVAYGSTLEEAFENAALALFELMTDTTTIEPITEDRFEVSAHDEFSLLYSWIEHFIVEFDSNLKLYSKFKVTSIEKIDGQYILKGQAWGEVFQPRKHPSRTEVKAITYHEMDISKNEVIRLTFLLDL